MSDVKVLIERARIKADMIRMGEKIAWGSDSSVIDELCTALEQMERERDEAREALKPFARIVDGTEHEHDGASVIVNVNLLRAARSALSPKEAAE